MRNEKKLILLTGGWGYGNIGDEAILASSIKNLEREFLGCTIVISSFAPSDTLKHHKKESSKSLHALLGGKLNGMFITSLLIVWYFTGIRFLLPRNIKKYIKSVQEVDLIVMAGGGYFNDLWKSSFISRCLEIMISSKLKKKVFLTGQTIGPFRTKISKSIAKWVIEKTNLVAVRDFGSKKGLEALGLQKEIYITADEANNIEKVFGNSEKSELHDGIKRIGIMIQEYRPYVSTDNIESNGKQSAESYYKNLACVLELLSNRYNVQLVFLPSTNWDINACKKVIKRMKNNKDVQLKSELQLSRYIDEIKKNDIMLSTNMHPLILSAAYNIPIIGISYWYKIDNFMKTLGLEKYLIKIDDINVDQILRLFRDVINNTDEIKLQLNRNTKILQEKANLNATLIRDYLTMDNRR